MNIKVKYVILICLHKYDLKYKKVLGTQLKKKTQTNLI